MITLLRKRLATTSVVVVVVVPLAVTLLACRRSEDPAPTGGESAAEPATADASPDPASPDPASSPPRPVVVDDDDEGSQPSPTPSAPSGPAPLAALLEHVPDDATHLLVLDTSRAGLVPWDALAAAMPLPLELQGLLGGIRPLSMGAVDMVLGADVAYSPQIVAWVNPGDLTQTVLVHLPGETGALAAGTDHEVLGKRYLASDLGWGLLVLDEDVVALVPAEHAESLASAATDGEPVFQASAPTAAGPLDADQIAAVFWTPSPLEGAGDLDLGDYDDLGEGLDAEAAQLMGLLAPELSMQALAGRLDKTPDGGVTLSLGIVAVEGQAAGVARIFEQPVVGLAPDPATASLLADIWSAVSIESGEALVEVTVPVSADQLKGL